MVDQLNSLSRFHHLIVSGLRDDATRHDWEKWNSFGEKIAEYNLSLPRKSTDNEKEGLTVEFKDLLLALNFWLAWEEEVRFCFPGLHENIAKWDWPVIARELASTLEKRERITNTQILMAFGEELEVKGPSRLFQYYLEHPEHPQDLVAPCPSCHHHFQFRQKHLAVIFLSRHHILGQAYQCAQCDKLFMREGPVKKVFNAVLIFPMLILLCAGFYSGFYILTNMALNTNQEFSLEFASVAVFLIVFSLYFGHKALSFLFRSLFTDELLESTHLYLDIR
jgi:hypothetical protein